jgi:hypothetical protein
MICLKIAVNIRMIVEVSSPPDQAAFRLTLELGRSIYDTVKMMFNAIKASRFTSR